MKKMLKMAWVVVIALAIAMCAGIGVGTGEFTDYLFGNFEFTGQVKSLIGIGIALTILGICITIGLMAGHFTKKIECKLKQMS